MKTLLELLVEEYRQATPQGHDLEDFLKFANGYLSTHRPSTVSTRVEANCEVTLTNGIRVVVSPLVNRDALPQSVYMPVTGDRLPRDLPPDDSVSIL